MQITTPEPWMMTIGLRLTTQSINLFNLGKYLEIQYNAVQLDSQPIIVGIKYNSKDTCIVKGNYKQKSVAIKQKNVATRNFNNQVSLQIHYQTHTINVKIFQNGNMHMSGIKITSHALIIRQHILQQLNLLHTQYDNIIITILNNTQIIDQDSFLYTSNSPFNVIGYIQQNKQQQQQQHISTFNNNVQWCIHGKMYIYDKVSKYYYSTVMLHKKRTLLSLNGIEIGYKKLVVKSGSSRVYKNHKKILDTGESLYVGDTLVGVYTTHFTNELEYTKSISNIRYGSSCTSFAICKSPLVVTIPDLIGTLDDVIIYNMFLKYNLGICIDKIKLSNLFKHHNLITRTMFDQSKVELTFKYNDNCSVDCGSVAEQRKNSGLCECLDIDKDRICTCKQINFVFFETGKVSVYGIKNTRDYIFIDIVNKLLLDYPLT
jgi:hypothetical protein